MMKVQAKLGDRHLRDSNTPLPRVAIDPIRFAVYGSREVRAILARHATRCGQQRGTAAFVGLGNETVNKAGHFHQFGRRQCAQVTHDGFVHRHIAGKLKQISDLGERGLREKAVRDRGYGYWVVRASSADPKLGARPWENQTRNGARAETLNFGRTHDLTKQFLKPVKAAYYREISQWRRVADDNHYPRMRSRVAKSD